MPIRDVISPSKAEGIHDMVIATSMENLEVNLARVVTTNSFTIQLCDYQHLRIVSFSVKTQTPASTLQSSGIVRTKIS
jgi:hypothetical protein